MNKTLKEIILDWIGEDRKVSSMYTGYDNPDAMYNEALSDLRARVPELVEAIRVMVSDPNTLDKFKLDPYELSLWFNSLTSE